jgi:3-dehydroquinate synthase class II
MGVFGFLSKAHLDQAVPSGDIQAQVQIFDDKIQTQKDNIKTARAALTQMDSAVDQVMGRSNDEKGADKAVAIRRSQARERTALQNDISKAQTEITRLQEQRAPVASQARQVDSA